MRHVLPLIGAVAVAALASTATSAYALPSTLALSGETSGEVTLKAESTTSKAEFFGVRNLKSTGYLFVLKAKEDMVSLGVAQILLTNLEIAGVGKCNTSGDAAGTVLIDNAEWHAVPRLPEGWSILILVPETPITCNTVKTKIKGSELWSSVTALGTEVSTTGSFEAETGACTGETKKNPAFISYDTDTGMAEAKLESSSGLGFEKSCEQIEGNIKFKPSKMLEVMN